MSDYNRIIELASKISNLLEAVGNNHGEFTPLDKDLSTRYIRELYEMVLAVRPVVTSSLNKTQRYQPEEKRIEKPQISNDHSSIQKKEIKPVEENGATEHSNIPVEPPQLNGRNEFNGERKTIQDLKKNADAGSKKTVSDMYAGSPDSGKETLNDRYKPQGKVIADNLKQTPIKDLKAYIGLNKRFTLINSLFRGSEELYEEAIAKVNSFQNYEEAISYIQNQLVNKFDWKEDDFMVSEFFMLVMRRYLR